MPKMVFPARCEACGDSRKFIEFKVEGCGPHSEVKENQYGFRCLACKTIVEAVTDLDGHAHSWRDGAHVEA